MREVKRYPTTTGQSWLEMSSYKHHNFKNLSEVKDAYDYIVVGAGYGGQAAARHLAELHPDASIAVFEAIKIGDNDSGKNAGFIIDVPHDFGDQGASSFEENQKYFELNTFIIKWMEDTIKEKGIEDVDWDHCGKYLCCSETKSFKLIEHEIDELKRMNCSYEVVEGDELFRRTGTRYYKKALYTSGTVLINPADVLRGMFSVMPENVDVFEEAPVMRIDEGSPTHVVLRSGKRIQCKFVLVTGGPFIPEFGIGQKVFCPVLSYGAFTRQFTDDEMRYFAGVKPWGCTAGHPAGTTVRFTRDNRIFVRNGFSFATNLTTSHQRIRRAIPKLRKAYENRYPELKHVNFEFIYGGMINMTMNYRPLMMQQYPTVFASASGEGAGVAKTSLIGYYLAEWVSGISSQNLDFLRKISTPKRLPPEPFLSMGAKARLMYEEFNAKTEI
ncbi:FAD-binding oxidoreductase [Pseudodesulfovibrio thermohalotolerans]|uniref:NAD(P)/FAD-dependent oxidoreductase n=1 Tax=Pseudodesulfovibrio thermohalotolerans TaxID=2880651 RepID=UPI0022BA0C3D|nr:FAD-binding oxidoreductase [Pseudodesulfovibrio thermohalotolerans]WFS63118.1 FAD-binding oxidoreductase [Pseudodesulfovibrio thermohalotolerans]